MLFLKFLYYFYRDFIAHPEFRDAPHFHWLVPAKLAWYHYRCFR